MKKITQLNCDLGVLIHNFHHIKPEDLTKAINEIGLLAYETSTDIDSLTEYTPVEQPILSSLSDIEARVVKQFSEKAKRLSDTIKNNAQLNEKERKNVYLREYNKLQVDPPNLDTLIKDSNIDEELRRNLISCLNSISSYQEILHALIKEILFSLRKNIYISESLKVLLIQLCFLVGKDIKDQQLNICIKSEIITEIYQLADILKDPYNFELNFIILLKKILKDSTGDDPILIGGKKLGDLVQRPPASKDEEKIYLNLNEQCRTIMTASHLTEYLPLNTNAVEADSYVRTTIENTLSQFTKASRERAQILLISIIKLAFLLQLGQDEIRYIKLLKLAEGHTQAFSLSSVPADLKITPLPAPLTQAPRPQEIGRNFPVLEPTQFCPAPAIPASKPSISSTNETDFQDVLKKSQDAAIPKEQKPPIIQHDFRSVLKRGGTPLSKSDPQSAGNQSESNRPQSPLSHSTSHIQQQLKANLPPPSNAPSFPDTHATTRGRGSYQPSVNTPRPLPPPPALARGRGNIQTPLNNNNRDNTARPLSTPAARGHGSIISNLSTLNNNNLDQPPPTSQAKK